MVFTTHCDPSPCHPPKRSIKVRLRKEEEKRKKENDKLNNLLRQGKVKLEDLY